MRILVINYEYPPVGGGGGVGAANVAGEWARQGHDVDYVTTHYDGLEREEDCAGVRLWREPVIGRKDLHTASIISMLSYPMAALKRVKALRRAGREWDIVNTHFAVPSGPAGYRASKLLGLPNVLTVWGGDIYDPSKSYSPHRHFILKRVVKRVLEQAGAIVPESSNLADLAKKYFAPSTPIHRIPIGYVPTEFEPASRAELGLREDIVYGVSIGRLVARKAYGDLLKAMSLCSDKEFGMIIVGDGPEEPMMRALVKELGIEERVHFVGRRVGAPKFQYLAAADFFALSPLHEGFGIVYQEAMQCGLPIVTCNVGGQTDFLTHEENALLSSPSDPEQFALSLDRIVGDADLRRKFGSKNLEEIQHHSVESVAGQYLELFQKVIDSQAS